MCIISASIKARYHGNQLNEVLNSKHVCYGVVIYKMVEYGCILESWKYQQTKVSNNDRYCENDQQTFEAAQNSTCDNINEP